MLVGVVVVYCPPALLSGEDTLVGNDYFGLHVRRLRFAQDALWSARPHLPGWYPRELFGAPFWSNTQNFPFIPTRWPLLLIDPLVAYGVAINMAALLAALFSYLYCRRVGLRPVAAAAAGWTFACSGFFAARVMAGHLTLLEAYPALPFLLWLVEVARQSAARRRRYQALLLALGLASAAVALAGHPQLPIYALVVAAAYALYRSPGRLGLETIGAMVLGTGAAAFALWPLWELVGRSSRLLALDPANNDVPLPYHRLGAFLFPWKDGWGPPIRRFPTRLFTADHPSYFWDTVAYVGWIPLIAALGLLVVLIRERRRPTPPWAFFAAVSAAAVLLALPLAQQLGLHVPALRSPARQLYLVVWGLSVALGAAMDGVLQSRVIGERPWVRGALGAALALHAVDVGAHDKYFVSVLPRFTGFVNASLSPAAVAAAGDGRVAVVHNVLTPLTWTNDDVGFFDSLPLARPYRAILDLAHASPQSNTEILNGETFEARALAYAGVAVAVTRRRRDDLSEYPSRTAGIHVYAVPNPEARARFFPLTAARFLSSAGIHERLRQAPDDLRDSVMLPPGAYDLGPAAPTDPRRPATTSYRRESSDEIAVRVDTGEPGFLRVLESLDAGWRATVDGVPVGVLPADDFLIAIPIRAGSHEVRLSFSTPGVRTGAAISAASLALLGLLVVIAGRGAVNQPVLEAPSPEPEAALPSRRAPERAERRRARAWGRRER